MRLRSVPATTRMLRTTSYSVGRPRSKNGITCSSAPHVNATPMNTSVTSARVELTSRNGRGPMPNVSRASRAASLNGSVSWISTSTREPASASISCSTLSRLARAWTKGSGTSGLMNAWMNTGRSGASSSSSACVSLLSECSRSAVTSTRRPALPVSAPRLTSATATATTRTA